MKRILSTIMILAAICSSAANNQFTTADIIIDSSIVISSDGTILKPIKISLPKTFNGYIKRKLPMIYNDFSFPYLLHDGETIDTIQLNVRFDPDGKSCELFPSSFIDTIGWSLVVPEGYFEVIPNYGNEWQIPNYSDEELENLRIVGAWKSDGTKWSHSGIFSIIDDDTIDGQIYSSANGALSYGYYSLLYPLIESLGLRGNLAMEGRRVGLSETPPQLNENGQIARRLQDVKGWEVMGHSMECIGEILNNWIVDSINSPLAEKLFEENTPGNNPAASVSIYDLQTHKQYHLEKSGWVETESRYIKPYAGHYDTKKPAMFNPNYDSEWAWGELAKRANDFGINIRTFVTHNSTSSHALVREIQKYLKYGFSDLGFPYYNTPPMLSTATRFAVEGTTLPGYKGEGDPDNTFNSNHFNIFKSRIDEAAAAGGWIAFNLHTYRICWKNSLPGKLVSEGGDYPDQWVIPILETDSIDDQLNPPARLGIKSWNEWYPCPGTKLDMLYSLLKYAINKGMINVTASEGFEIMGNLIQEGYYSNGIKIGCDYDWLQSTADNYPHFIKGANGAVDYYNPLITSEIVIKIDVTAVDGFFPPCKDCLFEAVTPTGLIRRVSSLNELEKGFWIINGKKMIIH